jgi:hypothetical protein
MVKKREEIEPVFPGDSCFPISPLHKDRKKENHVSKDDQMIKIVQSLDITSDDTGFIEN